jgi:hypothetical protein
MSLFILISHLYESSSSISTSTSIKMKRPSSASSSHDSDTKPYIGELGDSTSPSPPKSKKSKTTPSNSKDTSTPSSSTKAKPKFDPVGEKMVWDADGREALMDYLIAQGIKGIDKAVLAEKVSSSLQVAVRLMGSLELLSRRSIMS